MSEDLILEEEIMSEENDWNTANKLIADLAKQDPGVPKNIMHLDSEKISLTFNSERDGFEIDFTHNFGNRLNLEIPRIFRIIRNNQTNYSFFIGSSWRNEMMYLLSEGCKNVENTNGVFESIFFETLRAVFLIFGGREPITAREQKGIVGEIMTIYHLFSSFGNELIERWSRDALIDFDLEPNHNYAIESKCISTAQNALVTVSHYNQLEWKESSPISLLAVIRCTASKVPSEFQRLPELVDSMISHFRDIDSDTGDLFRAAVDAQLTVDMFDEEVRKRFVTRFEIAGELEIYEIISGDSADTMAKQNGVPNGVAIDSYRLNPDVLERFFFE